MAKGSTSLVDTLPHFFVMIKQKKYFQNIDTIMQKCARPVLIISKKKEK